MKTFYYSLVSAAILVFSMATQKSYGITEQDPNAALQKTEKQFFIENKGQWHSDVLYLARLGGLDAWITKYGVNYTFFKLEEIPSNNPQEAFMPDKFEHKDYNLIGHRVLMQLENHNPHPQKQGNQKQEGYYNYFIGNDDSKHATYVGLYKEALVKNVYEGIDIRYYFDKGSLRYDYIVHAGADPSQIRFTLPGSDKTYINSKGNLVFTTRFGEVSMAELFVYQSKDRKAINASFVKKENNTWAFNIQNYDRTQDLIIDPLIYSTYIGGGVDDQGLGIYVDASGNAYITGSTSSPYYDITSGAFQTTLAGSNDVFVTKLNPNGTALVYSTFIGGTNDEAGNDIYVDANGSAYVVGYTNSINYDVIGAYQTSNAGINDVFVTKLNSTGTALTYSTYIGGANNDYGYSIFVDGSGNAYVTGWTSSTNFDISSGAFQPTYAGGTFDAFVTKLNANGSALTYSTYLGGSGDDYGRGIYVDGSGNAYVTGWTSSNNYDVTTGVFQATYAGGAFDVFVTKLNAIGSALTYSTYLGGSGDDRGFSISVDASGSAYVTGWTSSNDYDITSGAFQMSFGGGTYDIFVTKLNSNGSVLIYSTYIGGSNYDSPSAIYVDASGSAIVTGESTSINYDITTGAFQTTLEGGNDVIVTKLNANGSALTYSTFIGGSNNDYGRDIYVDASGGIYVVGRTQSANYDITSGAFHTTYGGGANDVLVTKLCLGTAPSITLTSASGTNNQTVCVNSTITNITYNTTGATGATVNGLPGGVSSSFSGGVVTISGTPAAIGTFNYTVTLTGNCGPIIESGIITVNPANTITLTSASGTNNQTKCINTAITNITYSVTGATGASVSNLPTGVTATYSSGTVTISGTPIVSGTFNYTVTTSGACGTATASGTITVTPANTITLTSASGTNNQTKCINTAITNITYSVTGATGASVSNLPTGLTGTYSSGTVTISGTPIISGTFNYTVTTSGGCGTATASGTITVTPANIITLTSASGTNNQTVCINSAITNITYTTTGATGATVNGLPSGVNSNFSGGVVTISGTPSDTGTFNYTVTLTGGCGNATASGTITVNPENTIALSSATGTDNQTVCINNTIDNITYTTTGATNANVTGLPGGVSYNFSGGVLTISGAPSDSGTFNYTVTLIGGSCNASISGTIVVNTCVGIKEQDAANTWHMYPNPAAQQITIANAEPGTRISIMDMTGKVVHAETANSSNHTVNIHHLADGIYIVQLENNGYISQKKLVVNK
ncbi:MAG: SBBP repeat-containing protein [Bacteroidia bacterium]